MNLCQSVEAIKLLAIRTLPLYESWGSNHFHLDNLARTLSTNPSQFFFSKSSLPKNTPKYLKPILFHLKFFGSLGKLKISLLLDPTHKASVFSQLFGRRKFAIHF